MPSRKSKKTEQYEKWFGLIAIENGYLTLKQRIEAIEIQVFEEVKRGAQQRRKSAAWLFASAEFAWAYT